MSRGAQAAQVEPGGQAVRAGGAPRPHCSVASAYTERAALESLGLRGHPSGVACQAPQVPNADSLSSQAGARGPHSSLLPAGFMSSCFAFPNFTSHPCLRPQDTPWSNSSVPGAP